ncbi:MAG: SNF2 family DNA or RNA helicase, partial [Pseudoalteromonas tetraodonis]
MPAKKTKPTRRRLTLLEQEIADLKAQLPKQQDWRSSDAQEVARRRLRALESPPAIRNREPGRKVHSSFGVTSFESGRSYNVEIIDLSKRLFYSTSPDFSNAGLGTCKHTESVLIHLRKRFAKLYEAAERDGASYATLTVQQNELVLHRTGEVEMPRKLRLCVTADGRRKENCTPEKLIATAEACHDEGVRVSVAVGTWLQRHQNEIERHLLRRNYEQCVHSGEYPPHETLMPLFPYQREGMLHLAFKERAMVADEMGLGKTIQGIAAAALLHRIRKAKQCLIVCPASLKAEWQEQIAKFTELPCEIIYGNRRQRAKAYANPAAFFTIVNYEQVRSDSLDINQSLKPDIVILDEAQRIKNWTSQTAQAIKRLRSRYAFVLTGTPIENRIDELYSIVEFLDPSIFGALFRFNREYYELDKRGKPAGYKNLDKLRARVRPILLRRRKGDVEDELPDRSDENRFVQLTDAQKIEYATAQESVRKLIHLAKKRPLTREQHMSLMGKLGMMRMLCDTQFILDKKTRVSPKLDELKSILDEALANPETKVVIFSEWIGMLELVREHARGEGIGHAWHTGSVPQKKRRFEINTFREDPDCRLFLCTESGGVGLNLQCASLVINLDLPWNPAKLEQRIARAWRKGQTRTVHVINLIAEGTIEHGMLETLAHKQGLADGVLDG